MISWGETLAAVVIYAAEHEILKSYVLWGLCQGLPMSGRLQCLDDVKVGENCYVKR